MFGRKFKSSSDRFIPTRAHMNLEISNYKLKNSDPGEESVETWPENITYFNSQKHNYNIMQYRQQLCLALNLSQEKILNFSSPHCKKEKKISQTHKLWPVYPRKKPLMEQPLLVLDMPELDTNISSHVVDWGRTGYVATIYNKEVHLWHPEKMLKRQKTNSDKQVKRSVKCSKNGNYFAVAIGKSKCWVYDSNNLKNLCELLCLCTFENKSCELRHMDFAHDDTLVFGCSLGRISLYQSFSSELYLISMTRAAYVNTLVGSNVISMKLSCDDNFLAVSLLDGRVELLKFPELKQFGCYMNDRPLKSLCWHPWQENLLVICSKRSLILLNVTSMTIISEKLFQHPNTIVDDMSFNPCSGELVVSYFFYQDPENCKCTLTVLKNFDQVVDEIMVGVERVPYLFWDSTGTQLASGSAEENLCIWNFFGTKEERKRILKKGNTRKAKFTTNPVKTVFMFGKSIR